VPARDSEAIATTLGELGFAVGVRAGSGKRKIEIYGAGTPDRAALAAVLGTSSFEVEALPAIDWAARLQKDFPPIRIGRFFVHGSHYLGRAPRDAIAIRIDAGAAFGTGGHESTRACLRALDRMKKLKGVRVLDMGTGSGILAIAAAKLGAKVLAVDNDPQSVSVAEENMRVNGVADRVRVAHGDGYRGIAGEFDLVLANILARPIIRMAPALMRRLAPGGTAVLAGFLTRDAARVLAAQRASGLVEAGRIADGDWTAVLVRRRAGRGSRSRAASAPSRRR
jgi:ribosomal protein L11 methyltransferase